MNTGHDNFERRAQQNPDEQHRRRLVRRSHLLTIVGTGEWLVLDLAREMCVDGCATSDV